MWFADVREEPGVCDPARKGLGSFCGTKEIWNRVSGRGLSDKLAGLALTTEVEVQGGFRAAARAVKSSVLVVKAPVIGRKVSMAGPGGQYSSEGPSL